MATLDAPEPVNLVRSIFVCNVFTFLFSAGKACLLPFLTVYLKMLGLSATQTGLIIGAKTLVGLLFAPLWSRCAVRCGKRRFMLMLSLFVMAVTYLSLTAVPSVDDASFATNCRATTENLHLNFSKLPSADTTAGSNVLTAPVSSSSPPTAFNVTTQSLNNAENSVSNVIGSSSIATVTLSSEKHSDKPKVTPKPSVSSGGVHGDDQEFVELLREVLSAIGYSQNTLKEASKAQLVAAVSEVLSKKGGQDRLTNALAKLPTNKVEELMNYLGSESSIRRRRDAETSYPTSLASLKKAFYGSFRSIKEHFKTDKEICVMVLIILLVGESLSCSVEKIADDGWFEFLERIDDMEKYGMHRIWSSLAFILFPVIVTLSVDNTGCLFGTSIHPFMLHFYLFGAFLGLTFILSFFYPMSTNEKYKYATKVAKGAAIICCHGRSLMFTFTLVVMGVIYASYYNFLFWQLIDLGSKEITLGMCLFVASFAEIPMLLFSSKLVKKIGNGGVVCMSLLIMSARCFYYSFLTTPWAVLPAELSHAFTHTAMWWAILSSPAFNTTPALSRSIRSILSSLYFGVGFALGSIVSGTIYDRYGPTIMFQAGAVLAVGWFPILCLAVRCCKDKDKNEVKYTRLLASDGSDSDDIEDDWLEQALKDK